MNLKVLLPSLVLTITFVVVLASGFGNNPHEVPFVLEGEPARNFSLTTLTGAEVSLESFRGKPVVINFWSTWCGPCKIEHDILQIGSQRFPHVQFLGIVYQDTPEATREYLASRRNYYPQLLDPNSEIAEVVDVLLSETLVDDSRGHWKGRHERDGRVLAMLPDQGIDQLELHVRRDGV